ARRPAWCSRGPRWLRPGGRRRGDQANRGRGRRRGRAPAEGTAGPTPPSVASVRLRWAGRCGCRHQGRAAEVPTLDPRHLGQYASLGKLLLKHRAPAAEALDDQALRDLAAGDDETTATE